MKILIDSDVLLDVALGRNPHWMASRNVLDWCEVNPGSGFIAWHTVANLHYILRKGLDDAQSRKFIEALIGFAEVAPPGTAEVKHALAMQMGDFEDALQVASAVKVGADFIVTRNLSDYQASPVPVITPTDFANRVQA